MAPLLLLALLHAPPRLTVSDVPCVTVDDCWLDAHGAPIARPRGKRGRPLPKGDCGANLTWLRTRLTCEPTQHVCVAEHVGDRC